MDASYMIIALGLASILFFVLIAFIAQQKKAQTPYRIIVLGSENVGKTVFLASMYYKLSIQAPDIGFLLNVLDIEQRNRLEIYKEMISAPGSDFPAPTQLSDLREWIFTCQVSSANGHHPIMNITYLDYAGERIKLLYDVNANQRRPEFQTLLDRANVFLGILDGQELIKLVDGTADPDTKHSFFRELSHILQLMQYSKQPAHFVITKWDLVEAKGYSLGKILDCLLEYPHFEAFVMTQIRFYTLRLIPVSAVGYGFAKLQSDGTINKVPGARLRPFQVEMPLVCVLYDCLDSGLKKSWIYNRRWVHRLVSSTHVPELLIWIIMFIIWFTGSVTLTLGPFGISFQNFSEGMRNMLGRPATAGTSTQVYNRKDAATQVIDQAWQLLRRLEQKYPESNLTKFMSRRHP